MNILDFSKGFLSGGIIGEENTLGKFKALMNHPYWHYAMGVIIRTRCYAEGLEFVYRLIMLTEDYYSKGQITLSEYEAFDRRLILFKLNLLDKSDHWHSYIELYERAKNEKPYTIRYVLDRKKDAEFMRYYVTSDSEYQYTHFLYAVSHRYELIKRKIQKQTDGKSIQNLKHHTVAELTSEEIQKRFDHVLMCAEKGLQVFI